MKNKDFNELLKSVNETRAIRAGKLKPSRVRLTRQEREVEDALLQGELVRVGKAEFDDIAQAIARRRKNATMEGRGCGSTASSASTSTCSPRACAVKELISG